MIAFDFDDVIADLNSILRNGILKRIGHDVTFERKKYHIDIPGMSNQDVSDLVGRVMYEDTPLMDPIPHSLESMKIIFEMVNKPLQIITARGDNVRTKTNDWLKDHIKNQFEYKAIYTDHKSKNAFFDKDTRFFVDDHPHFVSDASKVLEHVFLMNKSWNENIRLPRNVSRIDSLKTVVLVLKKILAAEGIH